jgi:hypothetical protein
MSPIIHRAVRAAALGVAVAAIAACSDRQTAARADSDLSRDLALAGQTNAQPALQDTAVSTPAAPERAQTPPAPVPERRAPQRTPAPQPHRVASAPVQQAPASAPPAQAPAQTAPAPAPAPAPVAKVISAGTAIAMTSGSRVCTSTNKVGDKITATVTNPITGSGGATIPAGARVVLEVTDVKPGDTPESSWILLRTTSVYINGVSYPVSGDVATTTPLERTQAPNSGASDKEKVIGGAIVGGLLGQLLGHNTKGTVIGAAAGAATGAAVAHAQHSFQACMPEGASLTLTLSGPVTMS